MRNYISLLATTSAWAMACHAAADDEGSDELGVIELDESLADVEKPAELPAGTYIAEVQDVQRQTSTKGNDYFAIKFVIPPDEIPADIRDDFEDGAVLYWNRQLVPVDRRSKFNMRRLIESLGLDSQTNRIDPNEWMGRQARLRVVMGKYNGEQRAEIRAVEAAETRPAPATRQAPAGRKKSSRR